MQTPGLSQRRRATPDLDVDIRVDGTAGFALAINGVPSGIAVDTADLHDELDRLIVVGLQRLRPELYFLHAAVLTWHGRAFVIAGPSGHGKSTTAWGLLQRGAGFVSDELAPIDLHTGVVHDFARALCLKRDPPSGFPLPPAALRIGRAVHVPAWALPPPGVRTPTVPTGLVFVRHDPARERPQLRRLSTAESAARLYANVLNALAHDARGLDAAIDLAARSPAVALESGDLAASCDLLVSWMDALASGG